MMSRKMTSWAAALALLTGGCATISDGIDAINPFSTSGKKMASLVDLPKGAEVRQVWSADIGKAGGYDFSPAMVGDVVFGADAKGRIYRIEAGKIVWTADAGQALSAGVGADNRLVVVGTPKGEVLAFSAADGKPVWQARVSSEVLAAPTVGADGVAVRSGDNRVYLLDAADAMLSRMAADQWTAQARTFIDAQKR